MKNIAKELKDKRFSFFADPQKTKECHRTFVYLHTQSRHKKATKRANLPTHNFFCMYFKMIFF